jgi:hypothetical protein
VKNIPTKIVESSNSSVVEQEVEKLRGKGYEIKGFSIAKDGIGILYCVIMQ